MEFTKLINHLSVAEYPVGLGGCQGQGNSFQCCEHNVTVFDNKAEPESIIEFEGEFVKVHHGSLDEKTSEIMTQYDGMKIILDDSWSLRMLLGKIKEKGDKIFRDAAKGALVDSLFCITKSLDGLSTSDPFASSWQKCGAYFIADAISFANKKRPSPTHMLNNLRDLQKNKVNEALSIVTDSIGIERATTSLLSRMSKSTQGFSDMVEKNNHSKIISKKYEFLISESLLADCYFYLGYINKENIKKIKNSISRQPDLIHILKVALDLENDPAKTKEQAQVLQGTANDLLKIITSN